MPILGITGSLGSGKTTVARMFAEKGARVVDADRVGHQLLRPGQPCFRAVVRTFGMEVVRRGRIDRSKLAKIVFSCPKALQDLCAITHPPIIRYLKKAIRGHQQSRPHKLLILDVPLLFETGLHKLCDQVVVVRCRRLQQIRRLQQRNHFTQAEIQRRLKAQRPLAQKVAQADFVIHNDGHFQQTQKQVEELCQKLKTKML